MEDEDNENGLVDKWNLFEEAYYKGAGIDTSLAQINNLNVSADDIDETREDCFYSSYPQESGGNGNSSVNLKNVIKGITKNILKAQPEENQAESLNDNVSAEKAQSNDTSKQETNKVEVKDKNMAEYAQYLGLQPASSKPECSKCHTRKSNISAGESNHDECDCSAEESSQADANSSKLSLVNNVELPSTSSSKPPCTENSHLSSLDEPELPPTNDCNSQPADTMTSSSSAANQTALASPSMSPSTDTSEVPFADGPQSPDAEVPKSVTVETPQSLPAKASPSPVEIPAETAEISPSPSSEVSLSPTLEISSSPASEIAKSPSAEEPQSLCADVPVSPSVEASQSPPADEPMSITEEAFQSSSDDVCMSPAAETPKSPLVDACMSLVADAPKSPLVDTCTSPVADTSKSPFVDTSMSPVADTPKSPFVDASMSLAAEATKSPLVDACMLPATETPKSPLVDTSTSQADDTLVPPSTDASQSPVSNDIEFLSTGSPKPQHSGSESPASNCSQPPTINICESASCDSSELPHAESSQSPPQISMELSCDSNSKELQTDSSEVSSDKYESVPSTSYEEPVPSTSYGEPVPSTSYEEPTPSTSYKEPPIPSTSSCGTPSTKTLDSSSSSSGVSSTSQASNFKITNKVYLCAACETYFENWNLFTHMREVHQRHICLFCLGMFGQAERLSHHLLKKHNVSDMNFKSAEDFFRVFIGPCYVVCCKCDKMFTETDNFENHLCPPQQAVQSTSGICSQCKKVESHADGCMLAPDKSDNTEVLQSSLESARTTKVEPVKTNQTVTNVIRHSKRTIKPNRHNDDIYLYTKLTNIRTKRSKLQSTSETSDCSDTHKDSTEITEVTRNSFSDTPMEVDTGNKNSFQNDTLENDNHESENEILSRVSAKDTYDSITETVMEVSQGTNHNESAHTSRMSSSNLENTLDCSTSKGTVETSEPKDEDDVRLKENNAASDETKELHLEPNSFDNANENDNSDSESQASDSSSDAADESFNTNDKVPTPTKKEQNKPVLSATPVTDRSLVIKICTKNNSVYSIKTPSHVENSIENHDSSRESEENNNSEESDKAPAAEESVKEDVQESNPDGEKTDVTENCENDLGSINFDSDVGKENKSEVNNQMDEKSEANCNLDEKPVDDAVDNKIDNFDGIPLAGEEISVVDLDVDDLLENMELENLLKRCIKAVCGICVYCNHARHIAVNGKQLSLHMLSEHRFQPQHPAIIINQEQFIVKVKKCFNELDSYYFNLDSYNTKQGTYTVSMVKTYECFHCRFYSNSHKELYLHNRKMHQKPILICIMCKSTFLSYSELLCHLCPGVYAANVDIKYRCCFCNVSNIPSAFRLMVHLRKLHHACDVCLEITGNQQNLSNHVWKHKLHHLCYRCGIAYRNKPDITKHLFWKHGTESVLCKKCLQKKWPYIYHFCVPPTDFHCEECGFICHKAVALKVHKRIHANEYPHSCSQCPEKLISKKLLARHEKSHREPEPPPPVITAVETNENQTIEEDVHVDVCNTEVKENEIVETVVEETPKEPVKKVVDVLDLPPLNLSDSDSDSDDEKTKPEENKDKEESEKIEIDVVDKPETIPSGSPTTTEPANDVVTEIERNETEKKQEEQIMDGIWDNFKSYTASLEKQESMEVDSEKPAVEDARTKEETETLKKAILADHDYCVVYPNKGEEGQSPTSQKTEETETDKAKLPVERTPSPSPTSKPQSAECESPKKKAKTPKKKKQNTSGSSSDSTSDSDSSNCSCGTGCSCSSSSSSGSSSSSSSSDSDSSSSDSPKKASREKRKKAKAAAKVEEKNVVIAEPPKEAKQEPVELKIEVEVTPIEPPKPVIPVLVIRESDLETTETDTDEEFYDENPQQTASKLLAEKRKQMLLASGIPADAAAAPVNGVIDNDPSSAATAAAALPDQVEAAPVSATKQKFKTRKRRKGLWGKARTPAKSVESIKVNIPKTSYQRRGAPRGRRHSTVSNVSSVSVFEANQMMTTASSGSYARTHSLGGSGSEMDNTRSSKRKRVPKRFYDDSSDEENHMQRMLKWRRTDAPPLVAAPSPLPSSSKQSFQQQQQLLLQQQQQQQQLLIQQQQQLIMQQQQQQLIIQQQQQQLQYQQEQLLQAQRQQKQQFQQHNEDNDDEEKALVIAASDSDSNDSSSSDSSDSENETTAAAAKNEVPAAPATMQPVQPVPPPGSQTLYHTNYPQMHPIIPERSSNLYCCCQCPYDEVSEMIACDGDDCQIEWFHFECVGISVPPKGKWFCPDCRKNLGMSDEEMARG